MTKRKVWRYKCDHCKKSGCSASHLKRHEEHCCRNPNRKCRVCDLIQECQTPMAELLAVVETSRKAFGDYLGELRKAANGCPACMLATLMQMNQPQEEWPDFDYKKEMQRVFESINSDRHN